MIESMLSGPEGSGLVVDIAMPANVRAPFLARRLAGSLIVGGPRTRAMDAALLVSELTTMLVPADEHVRLALIEAGRAIRVELSGGRLGQASRDGLTTRLLDRLTDRWNEENRSIWFEIDLVRKRDLSRLPDSELFELLPIDRDARDELFDRYVGFAASVAHRYRSRGSRRDDVEQVAYLGLVQALDRFDTEYGVRFTTFAGQWIAGVVKRYLRDHTWPMRVPRSLKNDVLDISRAQQELAQKLGREPHPGELADAAGVTRRDVDQAILAGDTYAIPSLDAPLSDGVSGKLSDLLGAEDETLTIADDWHSIESVLDQLPDRQKQILYLRFFEDLTQSEIASIVGISQVHVSRLLSQSLADVRRMLSEPAASDALG